MKKIIKLFSVLLLLQVNGFAQNDNDNSNKDKKRYAFEKTKTYSKTYSLSGSDKVSLDSKFGDMDIHTWNKNEIKVDVTMKVTAETDAWASSVLEDIQVEDSKSGDLVKFKTLFNEDLDKKEGGTKHLDKYKNKNSHQTLEVNYIVYMPASNTLDIDNSFGAITLPDYSGEVDLTSKFGKLETGNLSNVKKINVEFGKAKLGNIPGGGLSIKYSTATIAKLSGTVRADIEFCNKIKLNLDNSLNTLELKVSYSSVSLSPSNELQATYTVGTSFGSFNNKTNLKFSNDGGDDDKGPKFDRKFLGKSGTGNIKVNVMSSFSTIILGDATDEDFKDKQKNKSKHKVTT